MDIRITSNIADVRRQLTDLVMRQVPYAMSRALNDVAEDGHKAMQAEMRDVFDRPTRWTLNAFMVWRSSKTNLIATIRERPSVGSRHYLKVQNTGGTRPQTGLEKLLEGKVAMSGIFAAVTPAAGAKRDAYGNWSVGERNQALSAIKAQRDGRSNTTTASAGRSRAKGRAKYWTPRPGSGLSPGIYKRDSLGFIKVENFTRSMPSYQRRIDFGKVALTDARKRYETHFARRLRDAMATAK